MTTLVKREEGIPFVPGFWPLVALGGLLGYVLCLRTGDIFTQRLYYLFGTFCAGFGWAYIFLQAFEVAGEALVLLRDPLPLGLDVGRREAVADHVAKLTGTHHVTVRIRNLLNSWIQTGDPCTVIDLAAWQTRSANRPAIVGAFFGATVFLVGAFLYADPWLTWGGLAVLALVLFTRQTFLMQLDLYIESRLLSRLPASVMQTNVTAHELAGAIGTELTSALKQVLPEPEKTAEAIRSATDSVMSRAVESLQTAHTKLAEKQSAVLEKLTELASLLDRQNQALAQSMREWSERLGAVLKEHAEVLRASGTNWGAEITSAITGTLQRFASAEEALCQQLEKVAALQASVEQVLRVQEAVEGAIKSATASEEFAKLISALREHLEASDNLLRELSKPRTIRLVEMEGEIAEGEPLT